MIGQLPETFKKNERFLRLWLKPLWAENAAALDGGGLLFSYFRLLSLLRRGGAGCGPFSGLGGGKRAPRTFFRGRLRLGFWGGPPPPLALCLPCSPPPAFFRVCSALV